MNTRTITSVLAAAVVWGLAGCHSPTRVEDPLTLKRGSMPESWVYESTRSGKVSALPRPLRNRLKSLREDMVVEQGSRYFSFYGHYTPAMQSRIDAMNAACTEAYLVSDVVIASNLTPAMQSVAQTKADLWWDDQQIYDLQGREFVDDWRSLWLMDSPSILNRMPIVDTSNP
jgi:hypothetical protein